MAKTGQDRPPAVAPGRQKGGLDGIAAMLPKDGGEQGGKGLPPCTCGIRRFAAIST